MAKKKERALPESLGLPAGGVETHAHLDHEDFAEDIETVIARAHACGVSRIGHVFLGPEDYRDGQPLFAAHPEVFFILGVHPQDAKDLTPARLNAMREAIAADPRVRAVGEIGLDYHYEYSPRDVQDAAFRAQLAMARELDRPVVIHSRDSHEDAVRILLDEGFHDRPLLWHCFGSDIAFAHELLSHGWHLSIPGPVTYARNEAVQDAVAQIPLDRLVLETDCPYLAPEPWRGKRNEPAFIGFTAVKVAKLRGMDPAELWTACGDNARRFFGLDN
ncbi:TatD DNase family protein [Desulfobaculum xiamenense]|uniref:TatD DNase family protein n=1 Tax=Desulfobaculum xiamenense TaxID=995050 RepID=A0A846QIV8_9BACT|nr:TatD family hydrolase [Desulfobaculum xiamenense]NJB68806.1 TatD DNase family protein [Desulfobaculum xiamenense]